ncbi:MAG: stage III sporulation protein AB [Negativicutes bacterium]|nr:stage III sporulation protein AB [Negativicutes bacterium]
MWLKLAGSVCVVAAGASIGFKLAMRLCERPRQIGQVISCLAALKSYINYVTMPLPEALKKCTGGMRGPVADFFHRTAQILEERGWVTPGEAIEEVLASSSGELALGRHEHEILCVLGANLGLVNREEQYKYIGMVEGQLRMIEQEAARLRDQNMKMYRYLGICGSLIIVILLI